MSLSKQKYHCASDTKTGRARHALFIPACSNYISRWCDLHVLCTLWCVSASKSLNLLRLCRDIDAGRKPCDGRQQHARRLPRRCRNGQGNQRHSTDLGSVWCDEPSININLCVYACVHIYIWYVSSYVCFMVLIDKGGSKKYVKKWRPIPECKTSRSIDLSIYISIDLSIYLSIYLSIDLSIYLSIDLSIYLAIWYQSASKKCHARIFFVSNYPNLIHIDPRQTIDASRKTSARQVFHRRAQQRENSVRCWAALGSNAGSCCSWNSICLRREASWRWLFFI